MDADRATTSVEGPGASDVTFAYSPSGRVASRVAEGAGTTNYTYDSARLASVAAPDAALTFGYDGVFPTSESWSGGLTGSVSRTFDADHRLASRSVAGDGGASTITHAYDADGLLTGVSGAMDATIERAATTGRVGALVSAPTREEWFYSAAFGEISGQAVTHSGAGRYDVSYTRDALGRVTEKTETIMGGAPVTSSYAYDPAGRLTWSTVAGNITSYNWDQNGNRISGGAQYDAQDRLTQTSGATFTHTADGRRRTRIDSGVTTTYDYDALGTLRSVDLPNANDDIAYGIDGFGRRIERRVGATVTNRWIYDRSGRIAAELDGGNDLVASYVYLPGDHAPFLMRKGGATYRIVSDQAGSIRLVIDTSDGSVAQRIDYDPFGTPTYVTGSWDFQPLAFQAGLYDPSTGLVRMGARDYDPATGRFTAKDPIGFAGGEISLYGFCGGDPVNCSDPSGLGPRRSPEDAFDPYGPGTGHSWWLNGHYTLNLGVTAGFSLFFGGSLNGGLYFDTEGNVGTYATTGTSAGSLGGNAGASGGLTSGRYNENFTGIANVVEAGGGAGIVGSASYVTDANFNPIGTSFSLGLGLESSGLGPPVYVSPGQTNTAVSTPFFSAL